MKQAMANNKQNTIKPTIKGFFSFVTSSRRSLIIYIVLAILTLYNWGYLVWAMLITLVIYFNYCRRISNKVERKDKTGIRKADISFYSFCMESSWRWGVYISLLILLIAGGSDRITDTALLLLGYTVFLYIEFRSYKKKHSAKKIVTIR